MKENFKVFLKKAAEFFFYLLVFLTPILTPSALIRFGRWFFRWQYGAVYLVIIGLCLIFLFLKIVAGSKRETIFKSRPLFFIFLGAFVVVNFLSLGRFYWSLEGVGSWRNLTNPQTAWGYSTTRLVFLVAGLFLVILAVSFLDEIKKLLVALKVYVFSADLACLFGFYIMLRYLFKIGYNPVQKHVARSWLVPRLLGTALEPQTFANFLLSVLFLTLAVYFIEKEFWRKSFYFLSFCLQLAALIFTFSMGGMVAAAAGIFLFLLLSRRPEKKNWLKPAAAALPIIFLLLVFLVFNPSARKVLFSLVGKIRPAENFLTWRVRMVRRDPAAYTAIDRYISRKVAWKMFQTRPILGWGIGSFGYRYKDFKKPEKFLRHYRLARPHNQYLEILAESGLVGFIFFSGWLVFLGRFLWRALSKATGAARPVLIGSAAALVAFLVHGLAFGFSTHLYFWLMVGFILVASNI